MAGIVDNLAAVTKAWWHYFRLDQSESVSSRAAMDALRQLGNASLPALRHGLRQHDEPRVQLRCAVVLHWLGERDGLPVLIDAVRHGLKSSKDPTLAIVECFLMIGAPDATQALVGVWRQLPNLNDNDSTAELICRMWRLLRDSSMLSTLCETSIHTPRLFVDTIAVFGIEAIPDLRLLSRNADPDRRAMALRGVEQVPGYESAQIVIPMLQDENSEVRALAASAMGTVTGPVTTLNALIEAQRAGFSTAVSVQMLILYSPPELFTLLAALLTRYEPGTGNREQGTGEERDTVGAVREATIAFSRCPWPHAQVTQILCSLVNRGVHPSIKAAVAQTIAERGRAGDDSDILAYKTMWRQLIIVNKDARTAAASALARLGEPLGKTFEALIDAGRPQGNLLRNLHAALVNSQDVGQAVTEAVQHVTTWFTRVSRVTAKRFSVSEAEAVPGDAALIDDRVPELLRKLQASVLECLDGTESNEETIEALSIGVGAMRAMSRLNVSAAQIANSEISRTYTVVKLVESDLSISTGTRRGSGDDVAGMLREAAGQTLIDMYGSACFDTLSAGLSHQYDAVKITSAHALGRLGDRRAAPLLQAAADTESAEVARAAREAVTAIKRGNPEMMTLLRGSSSADALPETLLRPATGVNDAMSKELLLRPSHPGQPEQ